MEKQNKINIRYKRFVYPKNPTYWFIIKTMDSFINSKVYRTQYIIYESIPLSK